MTMNEKNKEFFLPIDGVNLHMKLEFPETQKNFVSCKEDKCPLVIVVHGLTGHMEEKHIIGVTKACHRAGCATLRVELFGHGQSEGRFIDHTILHWITELMQIIDYAKNLDFVTDLYMAGHSQGGAATILVAGYKSDALKAILPLSPAVVLHEIAHTGNWKGMQFDPDHLPDRLHYYDDHYLTANYFRAWRMLDLETAIQLFKKPVLLVHGTDDTSVAYRYSVELQEKYANAKLISVEGDDHCFNRHLDELEEAVYTFLSENL